MPEKLDRCVKQVMAQGHSEQSAFAICNAAMGEADWPEGITDDGKEYLVNLTKAAMKESDEPITKGNLFEAVVDAVKATFGKPSEVKESVSLVESGDASRTGALIEKAVRLDGTIPIKVIEPGWGTSGYYPSEILERDGSRAFPKGTQMFWNHQTFAEELERPEGSLHDLAAVLVSDARWDADGAQGAGLYAEAEVFGPYREAVDELASHIGVSIRATGKTEIGEAEGRRGPIVQSIDEGRSVDFVTQAGAGGKIIELFEAKRGLNIPVKETGMPDKETNDNQELQEAKSRIADLEKQIKMNEAKERASEVIDEALKDCGLPTVASARVRKESLNAIVLTDAGELDTDKLKAHIAESVKAEAAYLAEISGARSPVTGMGESGDAESVSDDELEQIFQRSFGLSESRAKIAAQGR